MIEESPESLLERIVAILPPKYQEFTKFEEEIGGTREIFIANWGRNGERKVAIKVDKFPKSKNAEYHTRRGYTTSHEIDISLKINPEEAIEHHIISLVDYYEKDDLVVSVEPWFENSKSLKKIIKEQGTLTPAEFEQVFSQVLEAVRFLIKDKELYHRDLNPSNILIRKEGKKLEARITDLANACSVNDVTAKPRPTAGARLITDPCLGSTFTGFPTQYDQSSEIYALGVNMLLALTGKTAFKYDIDNGTAIQYYEGIRSVLDKEGKLDFLAHNWVLTEAVNKIPWRTRKFKEIIHWCMIAERSQRISSIDELIKRFNEASKHSLRDIGRKGLAAAMIGATVAVIPALYLSNKTTKDLESQVKEANKYKVVTAWDRESLEVSNNLLEIKATVSSSDLRAYFPKDSFVTAKIGDNLSVSIGLRSRPVPNNRDESCNVYEGKVYLEGFSGEKFYVTSRVHDRSFHDEGNYGGYSTVSIPNTLPEGTYMLVAEIYSPNLSELSEERQQKCPYNFTESGRIMARKRIPIVVGNPKEAVYTSALRLGDDEVEFRNVGEKLSGPFKTLNKEITYEIRIPELQWNRSLPENPYNSNSYQAVLFLPNCKENEQHTLIVLAKMNQKIISSTFFPIQGNPRGTGNYCYWKLTMPGKEFSEHIQQYGPNLLAHQ